MKNRIILLILTILSLLITLILYYMSYIFNPKFYVTQRPLNVGHFKAMNGHLLVIGLFALLIMFTIIFVVHIKKDNDHLEMFDQSGIPEFYKKNNLFSLPRLFQYYTLISGYILLIRSTYRSITFDDAIPAVYIFRTDFMLVLWDIVFGLFVVFTILLLIEYFNHKKTVSE